MAKPIAPTPTLTGEAIVDFFLQMEKHEKEPKEVRERIKRNTELLKKRLPKDF